MGGYGSTRWKFSYTRPVAEYSHRLEARHNSLPGQVFCLLAEKARRIFADGQAERTESLRINSELHYKSNERPSGVISYAALMPLDPAKLPPGATVGETIYFYVSYGLNEEGFFEGFICRRIKRRWFFECKGCRANCRILYTGDSGLFRCRLCSGVTYQSSNKTRSLYSAFYIELDRIRRIEKKLATGKALTANEVCRITDFLSDGLFNAVNKSLSDRLERQLTSIALYPRPRGRPRKEIDPRQTSAKPAPKKRGRPRKRKRGRPPKNITV